MGVFREAMAAVLYDLVDTIQVSQVHLEPSGSSVRISAEIPVYCSPRTIVSFIIIKSAGMFNTAWFNLIRYSIPDFS